MKKKDYLIMFVGIALITVIFYGHDDLQIAIAIGITAILGFIFLIFLGIAVKEKIRMKKYGSGAIYIFSALYVNDDLDFLKLGRIILDKFDDIDRLDQVSSLEFLDYLIEKKIMVKMTYQSSLDDIIKNINQLLKRENVDLKIKKSDITTLDNEYVMKRREDQFPTFIHDLNIMTTMIREKGYELIQICPLIKNRKKDDYYFVLLPIGKLLDLGQIGILG